VTGFRLPPLFRYYAGHSQLSPAPFSLPKFHCFRAIWTEVVLETLSAHTDCASVRVCCIGNKFSGFYTVGGSVVFPLLVFNKLLEPDKSLKLKKYSNVRYADVRDGLTGRYCNGPEVCAVFCDRTC